MVETVVVTASEGSFPGLVQALKGIRVDVEEHPLISFADPPHWAPVDHALSRLSSYSAVAITSPRAAAAIAGRMGLRRKALPEEAAPPVWASGTATADALRGVLGPVLTPNKPRTSGSAAADLGLAMVEAKVIGPVLFPCGERRRDELPELLRGRGIQVDEVVCYRSVLASEVAAQAAARRATVLVVASPSVAALLVRACPPDSRPEMLAVGPTTASSAKASGWVPSAVAGEPTADAVAAAVRDVLAKRSSHE
jgi:uroporphyrinogen-III synthase